MFNRKKHVCIPDSLEIHLTASDRTFVGEIVRALRVQALEIAALRRALKGYENPTHVRLSEKGMK